MRRRIVKPRQAGNVSRCHEVAKTKKSFDKERKRKGRSNDGLDRMRREKREKERKNQEHGLREVLIYRDAGTLRLRLKLTANLRVNSLGDKLAELRRKYSWHYAYA